MFSYSGLVYKVCRDSFVTSIKPVLVRICFPLCISIPAYLWSEQLY